MREEIDQKEKDRLDSEQDKPSSSREGNGRRSWGGNIGTKRQTYHIYVDLIAKLRGYAYWKRRSISELVNDALEQFFKDKQVKPRPPKNSSSKKKN